MTLRTCIHSQREMIFVPVGTNVRQPENQKQVFKLPLFIATSECSSD